MEIKDHTHQISTAFDTMRHEVATILDGARHDISAAWDGIRHDVAAIVDAIPGDVQKGWDTARHDAATVFDGMRHDAAAAWDALMAGVNSMVSSVLSFFSKLPGQVTSFLASLPGQMLTIGKNVIIGLINGIISAAADIPSLMMRLASEVASYFTDPLKLFSPSRVFFEHGFNIVQGAINGVKANAPQLLSAMRQLGGAVAAGALPGAGVTAGSVSSTSVHVSVPTTVQGATSDAYSSPQFQQYMQSAVQEAVLRYAELNPTNGLTPAWGR
jgi:phage-related protein